MEWLSIETFNSNLIIDEHFAITKNLADIRAEETIANLTNEDDIKTVNNQRNLIVNKIEQVKLFNLYANKKAKKNSLEHGHILLIIPR